MRISSNEDDCGHAAWVAMTARGVYPRIFLNGALVAYCSMADEERGVVTIAVLDADGNLQIDPRDPSRVWVEDRSGVVRVEVPGTERLC